MMALLFWQKFKTDPFCPKLTQIWPKFCQNDRKLRFFAFFPRTANQILLIFCLKHRLWSRKIMRFSLSFENFKNDHFSQKWPEFYLNLVISGYIRLQAPVFKKNCQKFWFWFFFKILKKIYFGQQKYNHQT